VEFQWESVNQAGTAAGKGKLPLYQLLAISSLLQPQHNCYNAPPWDRLQQLTEGPCLQGG
jgi:hypothetical protein